MNDRMTDVYSEDESEPTKTERWSLERAGRWVAGKIVALLALYLLLGIPLAVYNRWTEHRPGERFFVVKPQRVLSDRSARDELREAETAGDSYGVQELIADRRVMDIQGEIAVLVLSSSFNNIFDVIRPKYESLVLRKCRVLSGFNVGKVAWIDSGALVPVSTRLKDVLDSSGAPKEVKRTAWGIFFSSRDISSFTADLLPLRLPASVYQHLLFLRSPETFSPPAPPPIPLHIPKPSGAP